MTSIDPSTAPSTRRREVKDSAQMELAHIAENGNGAFVLTGENLGVRTLQQAREEAAYEAHVEYVVERSEREFAEGKYIEGIDALREAVMRGREARS